MKIALYAGMFKKDCDGATKTLYELKDTLLRENNQVGVWAFTITPIEERNLSLYKTPSVMLPLYKDYRITLPCLKIIRELDKFRPDIIHIAAPDIGGLLFSLYAKKKKIPFICSFHTNFTSYLESYKLSFLESALWKYFRWFYNRAHTTLVPTVEIQSLLFKNDIKNSRIWRRGIHADKYSQKFRSEDLRKEWNTEERKVILFSGRFVWYKGLKTFINIYKKLQSEHNNKFRFVLMGDGPQREDLKREMPEAVFTGYLTGKDLCTTYASSDLLLFPSTTETFGNVVLEALSSGIPAIVSDQGGCREIIARSGGGVSADSEQAYTEAILKITENPDIYKKMQIKGVKHAASQSWDVINREVLNLYSLILKKKRTEKVQNNQRERNQKEIHSKI